ncbi:MAG: nitrous oxide reductase family maturation protein NosD [Candidatus Bathyarchaeia archaeon]
MNKIVAVCLLCFILLPTLTLAAPVDASRTLTVPSEYASIQQAIDAANAGDTVFVKAGTYKEKIVIDKPLILKGQDKTNTFIVSEDSGAIVQVSSDNVEFSGFTVRHDGSGRGYALWYWSSGKAAIHLLNVEDCNIYDNLFVSRGCGIWLYNSHHNSVHDNAVSECDYGITLQQSSQNRLTNNTLTDNSNGLSFMSSSGNVLKQNKLTGNSYNLEISSDDLSGYINSVDESNLIENKPVVYWADKTSQKVPMDAGVVILVNCRNVTVDGLTLTPSTQTAIVLAGTQGCHVTNCQISNSSIGIQLFNTKFDLVYGNTLNVANIGIQSNGNGTVIQNNKITAATGISIGGYYQTVVGNDINMEQTSYFGDYAVTCTGSYNNISLNQMQNAMRGISITASNNVFYGNSLDNCNDVLLEKANYNFIVKNTLTKTRINIQEGSENVLCANKLTKSSGIYIRLGHNNTIYANSLENGWVGVQWSSKAEYVTNNLFYHNNFINNKSQIGKSSSSYAVNFWDNGKEGNYWSDYNGGDWNFDGLGDTVYELKSYYDGSDGEVSYVCGYDYHPLKNPFDISKAVVELPVWVDPAKPQDVPQPNNSNLPPVTLPPIDQPPFPTAEIITIIIVAVVAAVAILYLKRH